MTINPEISKTGKKRTPSEIFDIHSDDILDDAIVALIGVTRAACLILSYAPQYLDNKDDLSQVSTGLITALRPIMEKLDAYWSNSAGDMNTHLPAGDRKLLLQWQIEKIQKEKQTGQSKTEGVRSEPPREETVVSTEYSPFEPLLTPEAFIEEPAEEVTTIPIDRSTSPRYARYLQRHRATESSSDLGQTPEGASSSDAQSGKTKQTFTLDEAYRYTQSSPNSTSDLEKAIRAMAYLLEWSSDIGNENADGILAHGLAAGLRTCADSVRELFTCDDILKLDGDPREILKARR